MLVENCESFTPSVYGLSGFGGILFYHPALSTVQMCN